MAGLLINYAPWPVLHLNLLMPALMPMLIFGWVISRPEVGGYAGLFLFGLLQDILFQHAFGTHALFYLGLSLVTVPLRSYLLLCNFSFIWAVFAGMYLIYYLYAGLAAQLFSGQSVPFSIVMARWMLGVAIFPLIFIGLLWSHRLLLWRVKYR